MYTCVTCGLQFEDSHGQKVHMKSEWHRYNLKRRVAQLPHIDEETFNNKIVAASNTESESKNISALKTPSKRDLRRQKRTELQERKNELLAAKDSLQARKDQMDISLSNQRSADTNQVITSTGDDRSPLQIEAEESMIATKLANKVDIATTTCLFCPFKYQMNFDTEEENVRHMFKFHGLYIPERKYLIDLKGLLKYLGEKIGLGNCCLSCSFQGRNIEAVREHMHRKRHTMIPYENEHEKLEISDFYDFSSTYSNVSATQDVDEWEDISDEDEKSIGSQDEDLELGVNGHYLHSETSLQLESGAIIGHRLLAKYYRQNLKPERILTEGQGTVTAAESRHFIMAKDFRSLSQSKRVWRQEKKTEDRNDRRAAKYINNQPHFRDPLLQ